MTVYERLLGLKQAVERGDTLYSGQIIARSGICALANLPLDDVEKFVGWKHYSGYLFAPVPDPETTGTEAAVIIFSTSHYNGEMWVGDYGALRKDLLNYMVEIYATNQQK